MIEYQITLTSNIWLNHLTTGRKILQTSVHARTHADHKAEEEENKNDTKISTNFVTMVDLNLH